MTLSWSWSELTPLLLLSPSSTMSGKEREDFSCERARWISIGLMMPLPAPLTVLPLAAAGGNIRAGGSAEKLWDLDR